MTARRARLAQEKRGARFSMNARRPSPPSAPNRLARKWSRSAASCSTSVRPRRLRDQLLDAGDRGRRERREPSARISASARALPGRLTSATRPWSCSVAAETGSASQSSRLTSARRQCRGQARGRAAVGREAELGVRHDEARVARRRRRGRRRARARSRRRPPRPRRRRHRLRVGSHRLDPLVQVIEHAPLRRLAGGAPLDQALHVAAGAEVAAGAAAGRRSGPRGRSRRRRAPRCRRR